MFSTPLDRHRRSRSQALRRGRGLSTSLDSGHFAFQRDPLRLASSNRTSLRRATPWLGSSALSQSASLSVGGSRVAGARTGRTRPEVRRPTSSKIGSQRSRPSSVGKRLQWPGLAPRPAQDPVQVGLEELENFDRLAAPEGRKASAYTDSAPGTHNAEGPGLLDVNAGFLSQRRRQSSG